MQEHLKTNILNFKWPNSTPTFYLSLEDLENCHPIHKSKFSKQIIEAFPKADLLSSNPQTFVVFSTTLDFLAGPRS